MTYAEEEGGIPGVAACASRGADSAKADSGASVEVARLTLVADRTAVGLVGLQVDRLTPVANEDVAREARGEGAQSLVARSSAVEEVAEGADGSTVVGVGLQVVADAGAEDVIVARVAVGEDADSRHAGTLAVREGAHSSDSTAEREAGQRTSEAARDERGKPLTSC